MHARETTDTLPMVPRPLSTHFTGRLDTDAGKELEAELGDLTLALLVAFFSAISVGSISPRAFTSPGYNSSRTPVTSLEIHHIVSGYRGSPVLKSAGSQVRGKTLVDKSTYSRGRYRGFSGEDLI